MFDSPRHEEAPYFPLVHQARHAALVTLIARLLVLTCSSRTGTPRFRARRTAAPPLIPRNRVLQRRRNGVRVAPSGPRTAPNQCGSGTWPST